MAHSALLQPLKSPCLIGPKRQGPEVLEYLHEFFKNFEKTEWSVMIGTCRVILVGGLPRVAGPRRSCLEYPPA